MHITQINEGICACKLFIKETSDDLRNKGIFCILIELNEKESNYGGMSDCCTSWSWLKDRGFLVHLLPDKAVVGAKNILKALDQSHDGIIAETRNFKIENTSATS